MAPLNELLVAEAEAAAAAAAATAATAVAAAVAAVRVALRFAVKICEWKVRVTQYSRGYTL